MLYDPRSTPVRGTPARHGAVTDAEIGVSIYPTDRTYDYFDAGFSVVEEAAFRVWRSVISLVQLCERTVQGKMPRWAAQTAIDQFNRENNTQHTFEEILGREMDRFTFCDCGEWVAYIGPGEYVEDALLGPYDAIEEALLYAPDRVEWGIVMYPWRDIIVVYRSPFVGYREPCIEDGKAFEILDREVCIGELDGDRPAYVLLPEDLEEQHTECEE